MEQQPVSLSPLAESLIRAFEINKSILEGKRISVNPFVATVASWYEKIRNAMDYREDEVILRAAIERILKRRLLFGGNPENVAEPLVRELVWARYFADETVPEAIVEKVKKRISLFLVLREKLLASKFLKESAVNEWIYQLLSADLERLLYPNKELEIMSNFMYQVMRNMVHIEDDTEQTRDVQVFIAVRRAFAREDIAFLRFHLFSQLFGTLTQENLDAIVAAFQKGYEEIHYQLSYPRKDTIYNYMKKKAAVFFILDELLRTHKKGIRELLSEKDEFKKIIFTICDTKYNTIASKVQRAIIRSAIFIILTKAIFAFAVEGTLENVFYGEIIWGSMVINILIPPLLMIVVGVMIRPPKQSNSEKILTYISTVLTEEDPQIGSHLSIRKVPLRSRPVLNGVFTLLWMGAFLVAFGSIIYFLTKLNFPPINQIIFIFFLAIVSFLSYRISLIPLTYKVEDKPGLITPLVDFLFLPIIRVGRNLTEGISQINIFLFLFDFIIETPFKGFFGFIEQWFLFLHAKRENLG
ncbi:MAG: hypothetical protein HYT10_02065 [Candidatus Levybacteria bacterium]|nr:hypothetical protein [Candidatus Levybacteria bacterium]